jgi:hypothetical protein
MSWQLVAEGNNTNIGDVQSLESSEIEEGQRARLKCQTLTPVPSWQIDDLRNSLTLAGVEDLQIRMSGNTIDIIWRKGFPWAAVIILALVAIIVIVLWQFFKDVPMPVTSMVLIGAAILAAAISYSMFRRKY